MGHHQKLLRFTVALQPPKQTPTFYSGYNLRVSPHRAEANRLGRWGGFAVATPTLHNKLGQVKSSMETTEEPFQ